MTTKITQILAGAAALATAGAVAASSSAAVLYDNGPSTYSTNAWNTAFGFQVADSFTLSGAATVTGVNFVGWTNTGDQATGIDWAILNGSPADGGAVIASGTSAVSNQWFTVALGAYDVSNDSFSTTATALGAGTYWLELQNATTNQEGSLFWDENDGASQAWQNTNGTIGSHSFQILGAGGVPEPATWAMMMLGVLGVGATMRQRKLAVATA